MRSALSAAATAMFSLKSAVPAPMSSAEATKGATKRIGERPATTSATHSDRRRSAETVRPQAMKLATGESSTATLSTRLP